MDTLGIILLCLLGVGLIVLSFYLLTKLQTPIGYHGIFQTSAEVDRAVKIIGSLALFIAGCVVIYLTTKNLTF